VMKRDDFQSMSIDELWGLHEEIGSLLTQRMTAERRELDKLLDTLGGKAGAQSKKFRRPYPKVSPRFQNPAQPSQT
jgi:DNA-binding protein H-NS